MKSLLILAVAASALAMASAASAQTSAPQPRPASPPAARAPGEGPPPGVRPSGPGQRNFARGGFRGHRRSPEERAKQRAELFGRMDADHNGQVTFEEYRAFIEARRLERQKRQFERFSGGQSAVTLDQLNARALERERDMRKRFEARRGRRGPGPAPAPGQPPAPPTAPGAR